MRSEQVYELSAEIGGERVGRPQVPETPGDPNERFLHQVLGQVSVAGEEIGGPERARDVADVELLEPLPATGHFPETRLHHAHISHLFTSRRGKTGDRYGRSDIPDRERACTSITAW
jgi:hypothetical protein